jgi:hypothetical protein
LQIYEDRQAPTAPLEDPMINPFHLFNRNPAPSLDLVPSCEIVQARVLFATFARGEVVIDLIVQVADGETLVAPVALEALLSRSAWAAAAAGLLEKWAFAGTEVELRFRGSGDDPRVQLSDATSCMLLDLSRPPSLTKGCDGVMRSFYAHRTTRT